MLPTHILQQLSPTAAKVYLALLNPFQPPTPPTRPITASMHELATCTLLSTRTCKAAIKELRKLQLLERHPRQYHKPSTYNFITPTNVQPPSPSPENIPVPTPEIPMVQPPSAMLTEMLGYLFDPADSATDQQIDSLFKRLSPAERAIAVALAKTHAVPEEAHP